MPIYEYQCQACQHEMEVLRKISDEPLKDCPACGEPQLKKKVSAAAFRLKGGGWYETDFKTGDKKNLAGDKSAESSSSSSDTKSGSGKADSASTESKSKSTSTDGGNKGSTAAAS